MGHHHLTPSERESVMCLRHDGCGIREIARKLGRSPSTISRELARNEIHKGSYSAIKAQERYRQRRIRCRPKQKLTDEGTRSRLLHYLEEGWSPEQIVGRLKRTGGKELGVSVPTIYRAFTRGLLPREATACLRRKAKPYRKKMGPVNGRGHIRDAVSIESRPEGARRREEIGHWEGDTVLGRQGTGGIVTLVERKSRYSLMKKIENKTAEMTTGAIVSLFSGVAPEALKTLTLDNGKEFSGHKEISRMAGLPVYFAHPGCPGERGTNENTNGLVREYLPKGLDFGEVQDETVQSIEARLNSRPRKCLDFLTPAEVFFANWCCI